MTCFLDGYFISEARPQPKSRSVPSRIIPDLTSVEDTLNSLTTAFTDDRTR